MHFLFHTYAFDDIMKSESLKVWKFNISRIKGVFEGKKKNSFFRISKVLSLRIKRQINKTFSDITFKYVIVTNTIYQRFKKYTLGFTDSVRTM